MKTGLMIPFALALLAAGVAQAAPGGGFRERMMPRRAQMGQSNNQPITLPAGAREIHDVRYDTDAKATFDVYIPANAKAAPVIFMVHGGGWRVGDKTASKVVQNKIAHWLPAGIIVVSVDYPMLPSTPPVQQAVYVAKALAVAQRDAAQWGGDPAKFVLMGHSAGAHLVSLISVEPAMAAAQGARPWLGTVALDSAAYDVAQIMHSHHVPLYDRAFADPATWPAASPLVQLHAKIAPFLGVCSSQRDDSCPQAQAFAAKASALGTRIRVLPENLKHSEINEQLGLAGDYTVNVDAFLASLDPSLAARLH